MDYLVFAIQELSAQFQQLREFVNVRLKHWEPLALVLYVMVFSTLWFLFVLKYKQFWEGVFDEGFHQWCMRKVRKFPFLRTLIDKKLEKIGRQVETDLNKGINGKIFVQKLPSKGWSEEKVLDELDGYMKYGDYAWDEGRVSGAVYHGNDAGLKKLISDVFDRTAYHNPLHPDVFPAIRFMESEIIRMTCHLFSGDAKTCGTVTSGGTESIFLACKAYRDYARWELGIKKPNMVIPVTAHAAFDKAGEILQIKIKHIRMDPNTTKVDLKAMKSAINSNTCMIVGSAPAFPHGCIDSIEDIAKLGRKCNVPVHVDCCLGGFLVPFMRKAGFNVPPFDFSVSGVTSISADTHKYAYAPKGTSVVMYRNRKYRHYQYSFQPNWPGGIYGTPTLAGSRSGGLIATCWATLMYHGEEFYVNATNDIVSTARYIQSKIKNIEGIFVYGEPDVSVIAIGSNAFDIYCLSSALNKKGWSLNILQFPSGFHFCVTLQHTQPGVADKFLSDLRECTEALMAAPTTKAEGSAAIYGMSQRIPDRSMVSELVAAYLDACTNAPLNHSSSRDG